jgi:hypothetical protein
MKKTLLFTFALLFATAMMAQNRAYLLQESFNGTTLPAGWSISGQNNNWSVSTTNTAGGQPNEMHLTWSPQFSGMTRLVTPAIDLTGVTSVAFSFKHALDNYSGTNTIGIATTSDDGTTWNQGWSQGYNSSSSWSVTQLITTADMGQPNVKFCIYFNVAVTTSTTGSSMTLRSSRSKTSTSALKLLHFPKSLAVVRPHLESLFSIIVLPL